MPWTNEQVRLYLTTYALQKKTDDEKKKALQKEEEDLPATQPLSEDDSSQEDKDSQEFKFWTDDTESSEGEI